LFLESDPDFLGLFFPKAGEFYFEFYFEPVTLFFWLDSCAGTFKFFLLIFFMLSVYGISLAD